MPVARQAYETEVASYCSRAYNLDPDSVIESFEPAMNNLQGAALELALKHLYIQWGNNDDEELRALFVSVMTKLAIGGRVPVKLMLQGTKAEANGKEPLNQEALF